MEDGLENGKASGEASDLVSDLLGNGLSSLLDDKDVKHACLKELAEIGCRPPANHVVLFCLRKLAKGAEGFVSETLKSKLVDLIQSNERIAAFLRKIANLQSSEQDKNRLKESLLKEIGKGAEPDEEAFEADMTAELGVVAALYNRTKLEGLESRIGALADEIGKALEAVLRDMTDPVLLTAGDGGNWERDSRDLSVTERLKYNSGLFGFHGRDRELEILTHFLTQIDTSPGMNRFAWLLLKGPGGEGKSRLALEFCKTRVKAPWLAGKLDLSELAILTSGQFKWRPRRPTLFVIDYPAQAPETVNKFLRMLDRDWREFDLPVRVLLLERDTQGEWFKRLLPPDTASQGLYDHVFGDLREGEVIWP